MGQLEITTDFSKELSDWALAAGRSFQSIQTGFVHLFYGDSEPKAQTIPLIENALFVLALFRSRTVEQVQEGKGLLRQLLVFQKKQGDEDDGNFPIYLHDYPHCKDHALGIQLLAPFYWILKQFGHILGGDLKEQLEQAALLTLEQSLRFHQNSPFPFSLAVRLGSAQLAYGLLWDKSDWQQAGMDLLGPLAQHQLDGWTTTRHLADALVGLQMIYPSLSDSPWSGLWKQMEQTWHPHLGCYIGPCVREWQEREEPQVNLYDLFGGYFSGQFSKRATLLSLHHLHGVLIRPTSDKFNVDRPSAIIKGELKQQAWRTAYHRTWSDTLLEKNGPFQPNVDKTHTPYRLLWGDSNCLHSLVCQGGNVDKMTYREEGNSLILLFELRDFPTDENAAPKREIEFFIDLHSETQFQLNDQATITFPLGQTFQLLFKHHRLSLMLELVQGEGNFMGHVMRSNRPSQVDIKGEKRFQAYDWTIFLRTIRRQTACKIQATLTFETLT